VFAADAGGLWVFNRRRKSRVGESVGFDVCGDVPEQR
jgi:hypothetical protein